MSDYDYHNSRNFEGDTHGTYDVESAMPYVTFDSLDEAGNAMLPNATDDADYVATPLACEVSPDGKVTTRAKAGPTTQVGWAVAPPP